MEYDYEKMLKDIEILDIQRNENFKKGIYIRTVSFVEIHNKELLLYNNFFDFQTNGYKKYENDDKKVIFKDIITFLIEMYKNKESKIRILKIFFNSILYKKEKKFRKFDK